MDPLTLYQTIKILDWSKLIALADNKLNVTEKLQFVLGRVENIAGKGENAGYQHFLLFPQCFQKCPFSRSLKVWILWKKVKSIFSTNLIRRQNSPRYAENLRIHKKFQPTSACMDCAELALGRSRNSLLTEQDIYQLFPR